jgi:hypothetical protein
VWAAGWWITTLSGADWETITAEAGRLAEAVKSAQA